MAYESQFTGDEIDALLTEVSQNGRVWSGKQDKLNGIPGQVVGFDVNGNEAAQSLANLGIASVGQLNQKQNILHGVPGQVVGFDGNGNAVPADFSNSGWTQSVTLPAADWVDGEQAVSVDGVSGDPSSQLVTPIPAAESYEAYQAAGIRCSQAEGRLIFQCDQTPTVDLSVYVFVQDFSSSGGTGGGGGGGMVSGVSSFNGRTGAIVPLQGDYTADMVGALGASGNASNTSAAFQQAENRTNITTGEKLSSLFGKIQKWFADLHTVAFSGSYNDLTDKPDISSGGLTEDQVKELIESRVTGTALKPDWKPATLPSSSYWSSVTYGDGKFVAVAESSSNKAAYSTDGINWKPATLPLSGYWGSITYGDGKFVAVMYFGSNNKAAYSTDGINWTTATLPLSDYWRSVTYGDGKFVAVAENSSNAAYSTDGINWTAATLPSSGLWRSVTYGNGKFVAVMYNKSNAAYSTDGINWKPATLPLSGYWSSITYGDGKFVAVMDFGSSSNKAAYSTDGINWTTATLPSSSPWSSVTYGNGKFVAVMDNKRNKAAYSTDGINWTTATLPSSSSWSSVTYGDGKFVAVAKNSSNAAYSIG